MRTTFKQNTINTTTHYTKEFQIIYNKHNNTLPKNFKQYTTNTTTHYQRISNNIFFITSQ